jgi:prolyl-tRNA editing enzyme YbaK/EbsC (Cys-tRNA(Pro) deacylase)
MPTAEQAIVEQLNKLRTPCEIIEIDPEFSDTFAFCDKYGFPLDQTCNTLIVASKRGPQKYAACVVLANTRLDVNKRVKNLLGTSKASFATAEETKELTGMELGGVTPLSLPGGLPIFVDERVMKADWVILGGGSRALKIKTTPQIFNELGAEIIADLAIELGAV